MDTVKNTLRSKLLSIPILLFVAVLAANVLMDVPRPSTTERIDVCSSSLTGIEQAFGYLKLNKCPRYADVTVERTGFPFVEKTRYLEGSNVILMKCVSGVATTLKDERANKCESWAATRRSGSRSGPSFNFYEWMNLWTVFALLLVIRWLLVTYWLGKEPGIGPNPTQEKP